MRALSAKTWKRLRLLLALVAVAAFLFLMPARFTAPARVLFTEAVGPLETGVYQGAGRALATGGTLTEMFLGVNRQKALAREVTRLRNENALLAEELIRQQMRLESTEKLLVQKLPFRAVRALVSSYDSRATRRSIAVGAGTRDGVAPGMAAAADGALVGVVQEAGPRQCRVRLITDPDSVIACRVSRTRALCLLLGTGGEVCRVDWLDRDAFVEAKDVLVTTRLEAASATRLRVPEGLPAATVREVKLDRMRPLFFDVTAEPRVNLERLEEVEILIPAE